MEILDTLRQPIVSSQSFEERKQFYETIFTEKWNEMQPVLRQEFIDILNTDELTLKQARRLKGK